MNPKKILACNWKMNPVNLDEVNNLIKAYSDLAESNFELLVFPPSIYLDQFKKNHILIYGVQEIADSAKGAFTGQISAQMAAEFGCKYVLVGHSETREYLGVTDSNITQKIRMAIMSGLTPILCTGYSNDKNNQNINYPELTEQLNAMVTFFDDKSLSYPSRMIVAYEPVWAIGTGVVATNEIIFDVIEFIKNHLSQTLSFEAKFEIQVLYGGSVNSKNISTLNQIENLDGFLVGGASLDSKEFSLIAKKVF